jgi:hypothetical protein
MFFPLMLVQSNVLLMCGVLTPPPLVTQLKNIANPPLVTPAVNERKYAFDS